MVERYLDVLRRLASTTQLLVGEVAAPHGRERADLDRFGHGVVRSVPGGSVGGLFGERVVVVWWWGGGGGWGAVGVVW